MMECNDMKVGNVAQQLDRLRNSINSLSSVSSELAQHEILLYLEYGHQLQNQ